MSGNKKPWKKSFRKIPNYIRNQVQKFKDSAINVACVKKIKESEIKKGIYNHLDISFKNGKLLFPDNIIPDESNGTYSRINIEGKVVSRKDLPMTTQTYVFEAPNYGDWYKGSHDVYRERDVYVKDYYAPKLILILIELIGEEAGLDKTYIFKFTIDELLKSSDKNFEYDLFHNVNLLQENIGNSGVFKSDARLEDYLKTTYVNWEILPPDDKSKNISILLSKYKKPSVGLKEKLLDRYNFIEKLNPLCYVFGTSGFRRYFGAKFSESLVVFENIDYGNAIYVMYDNWEELSKKSRTELLTGTSNGFDRVIHKKQWKSQIEYLLEKKLNEARERR